MSKVFTLRDQTALRPLITYAPELTEIAPNTPELLALSAALTPHITSVIETSAARPKFDAPLRAFWLIP